MAFIVFEGGEGTGKSTQITLLADALRRAGKDVVCTREPGGTPLAESIRTLFKSVPEHGDAPTPLTELMLVMAARAQHVEKTLLPALSSGTWVVCDRFLDSSYVYQTVLGGVPKPYVDAVAQGVLHGRNPDLTLVLSAPSEVAAARRAQRPSQEGPDRMDEREADFHDRIDTGFVRLVGDRWPYPDGSVPARALIDAAGARDAVFARIARAVHARLGVTL